VKPATTIAIVLFSLIAVIHILRLGFHWEIVAAGFVIPLWVSVPGFIVTGGLAFLLWKEMKR
jgi:uncharacterized membrane protein YjjP (DUF1212 family)